MHQTQSSVWERSLFGAKTVILRPHYLSRKTEGKVRRVATRMSDIFTVHSAHKDCGEIKNVSVNN